MNIITLHLAKRLLALKHERKFSVAQDGVSIACVKGITLKTAPIRESAAIVKTSTTNQYVHKIRKSKIPCQPKKRRSLKPRIKNIYEPKPEILEDRFCRSVFALRPSTAILGTTIDHHLHFYKDQNPEIVDILKNSLYIDDLVSGAPNEDKAFNIYKDAKKIMLEGGFNLRKWNLNSSTLVKELLALRTESQRTQRLNNILLWKKIYLTPRHQLVLNRTKRKTS